METAQEITERQKQTVIDASIMRFIRLAHEHRFIVDVTSENVSEIVDVLKKFLDNSKLV